MRRKLIKQGLGGCTVSLPIKWVREMGLRPGDEVEFTEQEKDIVVSGFGPGKIKTKTIELVSTNDMYIRSVLSSAYKAGYDEIILNFQKIPQFQNVNNIINTFTGLEVVSQSKNSLTVKSFLKTGEDELEKLLVKMYHVTKLVADTLNEDWDKVDVNNLNSFRLTQCKLRDHCLRIIQTTRYGGDKSYDYYDFITIIEKITAQFYYLGKHVSINKPKKSALMDDLMWLLEESNSCYLKRDLESTNRMWMKIKKMKSEKADENTLPKTMKKDESSFVSYYYCILTLFRHLFSRLLSLSS
jgi:phosphate uptake regulator